jgi:hypothetical protein
MKQMNKREVGGTVSTNECQKVEQSRRESQN